MIFRPLRALISAAMGFPAPSYDAAFVMRSANTLDSGNSERFLGPHQVRMTASFNWEYPSSLFTDNARLRTLCTDAGTVDRGERRAPTVRSEVPRTTIRRTAEVPNHCAVKQQRRNESGRENPQAVFLRQRLHLHQQAHH